jgi:Leu/Phe-tRNA-protein transferase
MNQFRGGLLGHRDELDGRWLTDTLLRTLAERHADGWAHSIEVWLGDTLVGGAIGIGIGGFISGDSLFGSIRTRRGSRWRTCPPGWKRPTAC